MKKLILVALAVLPFTFLPVAALAQGPGPGNGPGRGMGPGPGPGYGPGRGMGPGQRDPERFERRARLARTLGLAEALDLDPEQALKLGEAVAKFDDRRVTFHRQLRDARQIIRRAAQGDPKVPPAEVDAAVQRALDARAQMHALDKEIIATVTRDLPPEKKARAFLFLERFQRRFGPDPRMAPGMGRGMMRADSPMDPGMENGMGSGMGEWDEDDQG
jgi:hypothetical protein